MSKHSKSIVFSLAWILTVTLPALPQVASAGTPFNPALVHERLCLSGRQAGAIASESLQHVRELVKERKSLAVPVAAPTNGGCATEPLSELPASHGNRLPAELALGLSAVRDFQERRGATNGLTIGLSGTSVTAYRYGDKYAIVAIARIPAAHQLTLGCANEATYRVTIATQQVYLFDNCVEAHVNTLPSFSQLPQRR